MLVRILLRIILIAIMGSFGMYLPISAQAEMVSYAFQGNLTQVDAPLASIWNLGQAFSGTYTFDTNAANVGPPGAGDYQRAPKDFHAVIGAAEMFAGIPAGIGGLGSININNGGFPPGSDSYQVSISTTGPSVVGFVPSYFILELIDSTGSALINNSLTSVPPILSLFQERTVTFGFFRSVNGEISFASAKGQVTGLTPVPLPAAAVFFGTGLLSLAGHREITRWRRRVMRSLFPHSKCR